MKFKEYFKKTKETAQYSDYQFPYLALGLVGEAGEAADIIKKTVRYMKFGDKFSLVTTKDRTEDMKLELGDVLWYWCRLVDDLGFDPEELMEKNYNKLTERYA